MTDKLVERTQRYLLASVEEMQAAKLPENVQQRMLRLRELYAYWLQNPRLADSDIVHELRERHGVGVTQAYEDVRLIKICLGNLNRLTKDYDRWLFRQRCEEGWQMAREADDPKAFASVTATYLKGTLLDKEDNIGPDYSLIVPQTFTISADPSVAGFKVVPGILEKAKRLEARYIQEAEVVNEEFPEEPENPKNT